MLPHTTITDALIAEKKRVRERRHGKVWPPRSAEDDARLARVVHAQLLHHFSLTAQQLPLLELNISEIVARGFVSSLASHWSSSTLRSPLLTLQSSLPPRPLDQRLNPLKKTACYRDVGQDDSSVESSRHSGRMER